MNYGIFVCSKCAGLHRELNHKVKGLGMCTFNKEELEFLEKWGNEVRSHNYIGYRKQPQYGLRDIRNPYIRSQIQKTLLN